MSKKRTPTSHGRKPPPGPPHPSRGRSCPLELVTTVPVVIASLLLKAAWRRVRR